MKLSKGILHLKHTSKESKKYRQIQSNEMTEKSYLNYARETKYSFIFVFF